MLFGTAVTAALGFGAITELVRRRATWRVDQKVHEKLTHLDSRTVTIAGKLSGPLGKWYGHAPLALAAARKLHRERRTAGALTVAATSAAASMLSKALDHVIPKRVPPPGNRPDKQSYPSGHTFETTAVAISAGYVLTRERLLRPWAVAPLALASLASGASRLVLDRHWASDLLAGYCAGIALGAASAGAYELAR